MDFDIGYWLNLAVERLNENFGGRLLFVGLQGSYSRGEATENSDIDLVVILDVLNFEDLKLYRKIMTEIPYSEKACGFISGKAELQKWSKADLFQFFYDTKAILGKLENIIEPPSFLDISQSIKTACENLYHGAVHSFVHSKKYAEDLQDLYKMTFFILQAKYFIKTDRYIRTKKELLEYLEKSEREILDICIHKGDISSKTNDEVEDLYKKLISWAVQNL